MENNVVEVILMADYEKIIKELDGADLFLRNRAMSEPAPLNEYDVEALLDIAKLCDESARIIEQLTSPVLIANVGYILTKEEIIKALQESHIQVLPDTQIEII